MREITECEVCSNTDLISVMNLGQHPLPDALVPVGTEQLPPGYPVEILFCEHCKTAHQRFQIAKHKLFPQTYHYRARQTIDVLRGMEELSASVHASSSVKGKKVLDVGCNDGSLLGYFRELGADTYGIEPTDAALEAQAAGHNVVQAFFDKYEADKFAVLYGKPDVITFTNVFAHIEYLDDLLEAVRRLLTPTTRVVIENHYLGSVIARHQFDTFYHEHPRTYSSMSFVFIAARLDMHVAAIEYPKRYGGNIRVTLEHGRSASLPVRLEADFAGKLIKLGQQVVEWRESKSDRLFRVYDRHGSIACAAFPGRAAILMRLLELPDYVFRAVYEKPGSKKIGFYVPGTHVPIVSDELYPMNEASQQTPLLNLAWHIPAEVEQRWRSRGFPGQIIQIVEPDDFAD